MEKEMKEKGNQMSDAELSLSLPLTISPSAVCLRWVIQHGWEAVVKSSQVSRIESNFHLWHFELSGEQMAELDQLERKFGTNRFCWDSSDVK